MKDEIIFWSKILTFSQSKLLFNRFLSNYVTECYHIIFQALIITNTDNSMINMIKISDSLLISSELTKEFD